MIKALTFDLFGTVLDLEKSTKSSIENIINNNKSGVSPEEFWAYLRHRQRIEQYQAKCSEIELPLQVGKNLNIIKK